MGNTAYLLGNRVPARKLISRVMLNVVKHLGSMDAEFREARDSSALPSE
jgi:hypothetical protein